METDEGSGWGLVERVRGGDDAAFDALMLRYRRPVLRFVFRMIGDADEAQEVAQDVFARAYRGMLKPAFRATTEYLESWLFQIARNAALDCLRRRKRRPVESLSNLEDHGGAVPDRGRNAAEEVAASETSELIAAAVARLPEDQRTAVILSEYEDLSYAQIAAVMKCSEKSVETRLYRARRFLRQRLAPLLR